MKDFLLKALLYFKYTQKNRTRERWYQELIKKMMNNKLFKELWIESQSKVSNEYNYSNFIAKYIVKKDKGINRQLNFYFFMIPVFRDPRFVIDYHIPANKQTFEYFEKK